MLPTCNLDWMENTGAMMDCNLMGSLGNMLAKLGYNLMVCVIMNIRMNEPLHNFGLNKKEI